ncbi:MAG: molybdopterin molybdotransferase MoeA [Crenarchaeota archaeon]|nr:molybdopterin molybdotransferase MoeA [Thermoproteota archaeon]
MLRELKRVEDVLEEVLKYVTHRLKSIRVRTYDAVGRILAEDVYAKVDLPPFDRSAVDGYAVRSDDVFSASPSSPVILRLSDSNEVHPGEAVKVCTGDPLPEGADAVIMREHVVEREGFIEVLRPVARWSNVSRRGEDFKAGELILPRGSLIDQISVAAMLATGNLEISVYECKIGLICTGSEIVEPEILKDVKDIEELSKRGIIVNTTRFLVKEAAESIGAIVEYYGIVPDDVDQISKAVKTLLERNDMVIVTGGTAVGERDLTYRAIMSLNPDYMWRGLAIRPAKPTGIAVIKGKPVLMLSGFPVAAYVGFTVLGVPIIYHMMNMSPIEKAMLRGVLTRRIAKPPSLRAYVRVRACVDRRDGVIKISPLALTGSGLLSTLIRGNAILEIPEELEGYEEGSQVWIRPVRDLNYCEE